MDKDPAFRFGECWAQGNGPQEGEERMKWYLCPIEGLIGLSLEMEDIVFAWFWHFHRWMHNPNPAVNHWLKHIPPTYSSVHPRDHWFHHHRYWRPWDSWLNEDGCSLRAHRALHPHDTWKHDHFDVCDPWCDWVRGRKGDDAKSSWLFSDSRVNLFAVEDVKKEAQCITESFGDPNHDRYSCCCWMAWQSRPEWTMRASIDQLLSRLAGQYTCEWSVSFNVYDIHPTSQCWWGGSRCWSRDWWWTANPKMNPSDNGTRRTRENNNARGRKTRN